MLAGTGFAAGSVVGGVAGGPLMAGFGWSSVFVLGGVLPLLLLPALALVLRAKGPRRAADDGRTGNPVAALVGKGLRSQTVLLWVFAFLVFLAAYGLAFWIPTLLTELGFTPEQAPIGAAAFGMGGLIGSLLIVTIVGRLGIRRVLALTSLLGIGCIAVLSRVTVPPGILLAIVAGAGGGLITGSIGQSALAVSLYPAELRATGVGWSAALGRIGSIGGPAAGGAMLALGWPARGVVLTAVAPIIAAILVLGVLARIAPRRTPA